MPLYHTTTPSISTTTGTNYRMEDENDTKVKVVVSTEAAQDYEELTIFQTASWKYDSELQNSTDAIKEISVGVNDCKSYLDFLDGSDG